MKSLKALNLSYVRCKARFAASFICFALIFSSNAHAASDKVSGAKESGGLPQLDVSTYPSQIFWLFIFFVLLHLILSRMILPAISATIQKRNLHIQDDRETASRLAEEAEEAQKAYEEKLSHARQDANQIFKDMESEMDSLMQKRWESFREQSRDDEAKVVNEIAKAKDDIMDDMNSIAAEIAKDATAKIVGVDMDIDAAKNAVNSLSKKVKAA